MMLEIAENNFCEIMALPNNLVLWVRYFEKGIIFLI